MQQRASGRHVSAQMNRGEGQRSLSFRSIRKKSKPRIQGSGRHCKAQSAMQSPWLAPQTRSTATALAVARSGKQNGSHANTILSSYRTQCCLTLRSSGAPTAGHQARSGGTRYIFASPGLASCRRRPLSSNVSRTREWPVEHNLPARPWAANSPDDSALHTPVKAYFLAAHGAASPAGPSAVASRTVCALQ